ncbi:glucose dehydrogenase [FAD, quinone]-like [Diabrotica undecimpunctata]|uniref:glucose dehydrogenase [FAD, quinone]-like n=1 Tax=Diabrotica undecimpunctata TaxID=50387 RepID=UPI003B63FA64
MVQTWTPPDLSQPCAVHTNLTTCQPSTFLFLQLVANLFGYSPDAKNKYGYDYDFSSGFSSWDFTNPYDSAKPKQEEYDFIIVGAGSAGCVVANRLTEIEHWRVLLLEAGDEEPLVADVPAFAPMLQGSSIDWMYETQPSPKSCLARDEGRCTWARGKVMGGSSTINYMIYIRGHPEDYDEWEYMGNHGWSYKDVLPYFKKSEDNKNHDHKKIDPHYHGVGGYQTVEFFPYQDKNTLGLLHSYEELGLPKVDQNSEHLIGTMLLQHTTRHGERLSTNGAFIRPIRNKRKNLTVRTNAHVTRILIDEKTKKAYGVEYFNKGKLVQVVAKKEVILSAGTINSPILLMLSGVGPASHLQENGIKVLKDSAVGFNLQDHTTIDGVVFALTNHTATLVDENQMKADTYYWKNKRDGPLASTGALQTNAFIQTKFENSHDRPDIQISIDSVNTDNFFTDPILSYNTAVLPLAYYSGMMARPILLNPESRGRILLNQSDPIFGTPLIYANTFFEEIDLLRIVEGVKQSLNLERTSFFKHAGIQLVRTPLPACQHVPFGTDEYWACIAMAYTTTIFHPVGTCKMGPHHDESAVVDSHLRVYGINSLRVIDASIMPKIVRGNTNAPTIMIAEKGSDFIKKTWLKEKHHNEKSHTAKSSSNSLFDFGNFFEVNF